MAIQLEDSTTGAKGAGAEFFASDIEPNCPDGQIIPITVSINITTSVVIEWTNDSGATWFPLGAALTLAEESTFRLYLDGADQFNLRSPAGTTVNYCRVFVTS